MQKVVIGKANLSSLFLTFRRKHSCRNSSTLHPNKSRAATLGHAHPALFTCFCRLGKTQNRRKGTPAFIWVYKWWGAIPVFITTYIPFFLASYLIYDKEPKKQIKWILSLACLNIVLLAVLIPLGII